MSTTRVPTPDSRLYRLSPQAIGYVVASARALDLGQLDEAEKQLLGAMALFPTQAEVLRLHAGIESARGRHAQALASMTQALAQRPDDALYLNTMGTLQLDCDDLDNAVRTLHAACAAQPDLAIAWYNLGLALMRSMQPAAAAAALRRAVALEPANASAQALLGDMLRATGELDAATLIYRNAIRRQPDSGAAWWGLANLKTIKLTSSDIQQLESAIATAHAADDRVALGFALAKALEDQSRYVDSLSALAQANAVARRQRVWNAAAFSAQVDAMLAAFSVPPKCVDSALGSEAIFIVSLPRSGSTLIEQILASHSQVNGAGELPDLPAVLNEESQRRASAFPHWVPLMTDVDWRRLGQRYLERTQRWRTDRPHSTDKLPNNWVYAGAIRAMLPAAHIVACRRDALETCLSCYRQHFSGNDYTRTFADLAAYWRDFDRAVRHWQISDPEHVGSSVYENLLESPERHIRQLLDFCGLPFEATCLDFHLTAREVHTPSAAQVREPLRHDTARAGRYGAALDPLRLALGMPAWHG